MDNGPNAWLVAPDNIYKLFGQRLATERNAAQMSQGELAHAVGLSRASVANIEAGRQRVLLHQVFALVAVFDMKSIDDFIPVDLIRSTQTSGTEEDLKFSGSNLSAAQAADVARLYANS